jgi:hypothetical protein
MEIIDQTSDTTTCVSPFKPLLCGYECLHILLANVSSYWLVMMSLCLMEGFEKGDLIEDQDVSKEHNIMLGEKVYYHQFY